MKYGDDGVDIDAIRVRQDMDAYDKLFEPEETDNTKAIDEYIQRMIARRHARRKRDAKQT